MARDSVVPRSYRGRICNNERTWYAEIRTDNQLAYRNYSTFTGGDSRTNYPTTEEGRLIMTCDETNANTDSFNDVTYTTVIFMSITAHTIQQFYL